MNCEQYRSSMTDADLPGNCRTELENHARECPACRQEFERVGTLLAAIDLGVTAQTAAEPSPTWMEQVHQRIRDESSVTPWWNARWVPAMACAAVLILAASVWTLWPRTGARHELTATSAPPSPVQAVRPAAAGTTGSPKTAPERHGSVVALLPPVRKLSARRMERQRAAPEVPGVIVQPGQMEAVMRFAQQVNSGQIDGAKLLADLKAADQPLEIKPLKTPELAGDKASGTSEGGSQKNFVRSGESR